LLNFSIDELDRRIYAYRTFRRMVDSLLSEEATSAVDLLRSHFIGFLGDVSIEDETNQKQADFLTAEGVLLKPEIDGNRYCMASALVDSFIRQNVISERYSNAPRTPLPRHYKRGPLDILGTLKEALKFFDKDLIRLAADYSYKQSKVHVGGHRNTSVPRESVYDTELMRILTNWLRPESFAVAGQYHRKNSHGEDKYSDIVIKKPEELKVVLVLVATGDSGFVRDHVDKTAEYKELLLADEAWVVHFTCEDNYLPYWQSDDLLNEGINLVHFWHDVDFTTVQMSARWKDVHGNIQQIDDQPLTD
jgi:hypothetical protein